MELKFQRRYTSWAVEVVLTWPTKYIFSVNRLTGYSPSNYYTRCH